MDVTNMIGTFGGMRGKMQSLSKMMKLGGGDGARIPSSEGALLQLVLFFQKLVFALGGCSWEGGCSLRC